MFKAGLRSRMDGVGVFFGGVGVLKTIGVGVFHPIPNPEVQWNHFYVTILG